MTGYRIDLPNDIADEFGIQLYLGWANPFTRREAPQAKFKNGTRVRKERADPSGDLTPSGVEGNVLGSIHVPTLGCAYFVEWEDKPKVAVFVVEAKLAEVPA